MNSLSISAHEGNMTTRNNRRANRMTLNLDKQNQDQFNQISAFDNEEFNNLKQKNEELLNKIDFLEEENQ